MPPKYLSIEKRQGLLNFLDAFGKWSLVDTLLGKETNVTAFLGTSEARSFDCSTATANNCIHTHSVSDRCVGYDICNVKLQYLCHHVISLCRCIGLLVVSNVNEAHV